MYEIERSNYISDNIYAGDFPVEIEVAEAKEDIEKYSCSTYSWQACKSNSRKLGGYLRNYSR